MSFYRAALTFHPEHKNPARASGKGVWRVDALWADVCLRQACVGPSGRLLVSTTKPVKARSRVDPVRLALQAVAS